MPVFGESKRVEFDQAATAAEQIENAERDEVRREVYRNDMMRDQMMRNPQQPKLLGGSKSKKVDRSRFIIEDYSGEQEADEEQIQEDLDYIEAGLKAIKQREMMSSAEVDRQNKLIGGMTERVSTIPETLADNFSALTASQLPERTRWGQNQQRTEEARLAEPEMIVNHRGFEY